VIPIPVATLAPFERGFVPVVPESLEPLDVADGRVVGRDGVGKRAVKGLRGRFNCCKNTLCWRKEHTHFQEQLSLTTRDRVESVLQMGRR